MPVHASYVFACNRGGVGKTTLAFQLVSAYAAARPELKVLLVDASLHADSSALILGGCREPSEVTEGARTLGMQRILQSAPERRAEGLVAAAAAPPPPPPSRLGRALGRSMPPEPPFDVEAHCVNVLQAHPSSGQPPTLFVAPGGPPSGGAALGPAADVGRRLMERLGSAPDAWAVFFDTDAELAERQLSLVALAAAAQLLLPLSASWNDYRRVLDDPVNALFSRLDGSAARIHRVVFNRISKKTNTPVALHAEALEHDATLPFTPVRSVLDQLSQIADHCFDSCWRNDGGARARLFADHEAITDEGRFAKRYCVALFEVSENAMQASQLTGIPFCAMSAAERYMADEGRTAGIRVPADALEKIQSDLRTIVLEL